MGLPMYDKDGRRKLRFGAPTVTFSIKIPQSTKDKIYAKNLDMPKIVYDIVEKELNPYSTHPITIEDHPVMDSLTTKLIALMALNDINDGRIQFDEEEADMMNKLVKDAQALIQEVTK